MRAGAVSRTPSAACGCACASRSSIRRSCSPRRWRSPSAAFLAGDVALRIPGELVPENGQTPASWLRKLTEDGLRWRFPRACRPRSRALVEHELRLIAELGYEPFFLTVHDVVRFARARRDPLPGPRLGGELGGVLCAGHHRGRSRPHEHAVRALRLARAQRAAGHRRRFRARAARGGDPVRLPQIRPRARRARRDGDLLPHEKRAARRRQGARHAARRSRRAGARAVTAPDWDQKREASTRRNALFELPARCSAFRATCRSTSAAS